MRKHLFCLLMPLFAMFGYGQILSEGFDDITTLTGSGWTMTNQSTSVGSTNWFQGNATVFPGQSGGATSYIGANYNNTTGNSTISNWLIMPTLNLKDGDQLKFWTRTSDFPEYNDRLEVRSSVGTMTNPSGPTGVGSFTNLLLSVNGNLNLTYPNVWTEYVVTISGVGTTPVAMNLAFRYHVPNGGPNGTNSDYIGIDTVSVIEADEEEEPTDYCGPLNFTLDVEPISKVTVAGIANESSPVVNGSDAHEFFLSVVGNMEPGESYEIAVEGNTAGNFTNNVVVFIDFNNNGVLNDAGEVFQMNNTLINSTGTDGQQALGNIVVPADAVVGETRMRVKKLFGVTNLLDPCLGSSFGQAEDYTINIGPVVDPSEGCLDAPNGQWPSATFTPVCSGSPEAVTGSGWTGEFSLVNVTAGTSYVFTSSVTTDFITISNAEGTLAYTAGVGPLTWTATATETVRFYLHLDEDCNSINSGLRSRIIQCGEIAPPPANDECDNAIAVACGDSVTGSTTSATNSGGNAAGDVFYSYTGNGTAEEVTVSLCGSSYDTYLRVFTDCTLSNEIAFNDDDCGVQSELTFTSDGTSTYYIMVEGYGSNTGNFVLNISCGTNEGYCEPELDCTDGDLIANVTFQEINNNTACSPNGFGDYTSMVANVTAGETYPINVTVGSGWGFESVSVWVDYDNSMTFDQDEFTYIGTGSGSVVSGEITVPAGVADGQYRMRVRVAAVGEASATWDMACDEDQGYGETEDYTMNVGEGSSGEDCQESTPSNNFENGHGFLNSAHIAHDFNVSANTEFTVENVTLNILNLDPTTDVSLSFYTSAGGQPGTFVDEFLNIVPTSQTNIGTAFGFNVINTVVDLPTPITFQGGATGTDYFVAVTVTNSNSTYWESTLVMNSTNGGYWSPDGGNTWTLLSSGPWDGVFTISGECATLGLDDLNSFDFAYYPNPTKDVLNISSQKGVESVQVYNLAGQQVMSNGKVSNGQINVQSLSPGTYVFRVALEGGQVETFKIIKK